MLRILGTHAAYRVVLVGLLCAGSLSGYPVHAAEGPPPIRGLRVEPAAIVLDGGNRQQQVLVTAEDKDGRPLDATHDCQLRVGNPAVARVVGSVVVAVANGTTALHVQRGTHQVEVPIQVTRTGEYPPVDFGNDVVPIFSKLGCNSGSCHGKASGQNGFKLSVFGFDPAADYDALVKEARGRRLFPASPDHSLLLRKSTGRVAHGGGRRLQVGSKDHELLLAWIGQGMPAGQADAPRLVGLRVRPAGRTMGFDSRQQLLATAVYSDGSLRDVTDAASYTSNASTVAAMDRPGLVRIGKTTGEAAITVNYMGQVGAVRLQVPRPGGPNPYPELAVNNRVDELVWAKLRTMGIVPSPLADEATFLRRVYLDTLGTLPRPDEVRAFRADARADKRRRWIDQLLGRPEYADYWALKWADILLVNRDQLGDRGAFEFHRWLRSQFSENRPYDQWVRELVTATGNSGKHGPVNFYRSLRTPEDLARAVSQAFLGVRVECAQCHHHPFEKWGQQDFYGMAGFFNGIERKPLGEGRELVYHPGHRAMRIAYSNEPVATRALDGPPPVDLERGDPRLSLAQWLTDAKNPWFARLAANRLWKHFLGRGLVEPEDDLRSTNPATNEPLLAYLTSQVVESGHDLKAVMRLILNARVYQLSSVPNETNRDDEQNYAHYHVKRLPAEVLLDAICEVTGVPEAFPGRPAGTRAIELWDNRLPSYFLDIFGRSERKSPCECGRSGAPTMTQALHLMNAPEVERKISSPAGRVARLLKEEPKEAKIVEELCLVALGRPPTDKERQVARKLFAQASPQEAAQDFLWTLLNSYDFLFVQ